MSTEKARQARLGKTTERKSQRMAALRRANVVLQQRQHHQHCQSAPPVGNTEVENLRNRLDELQLQLAQAQQQLYKYENISYTAEKLTKLLELKLLFCENNNVLKYVISFFT